MKIYKTADIFGITREVPINYIVRKSVDERLIENLSRDKHLVIFGSSKQGKTSLRKHTLEESDYIVIHCSNKWSVSEINNAILKRAGFEITLSDSKAITGKNKIIAKANIGIPGLGVSASGEAIEEKQNNKLTKPLELDSEDVNDVINALESIDFHKYIVLEDFHYLDTATQKDFSVALKAFHESSKFCFMIIGVWLEENRLTVYNGDLTGRISSINADEWKENELRDVVKEGEKLLNISFHQEFIDELIASSHGSISIVQEACYKCCEQNNIHETTPRKVIIGSKADASKIVNDVINQHSGRFSAFITNFSDGFQATKLEMFKWLLHPILNASTEELRRGLKYSDITKALKQNHPEKSQLNQGNVAQALLSCADLQVKKDIKPLILDYDQTNTRLRVVDNSFLIWLNKQNKNELLELAGLPLTP